MSVKNYNKVVVNNRTIIDLTADTVTSETLLSGYIAHSSDGSIIVGNKESLESTSLRDSNNSDILDSSGSSITIDTAYISKASHGDIVKTLEDTIRQYEELIDLYSARLQYCVLDSDSNPIGL